MASVAVAVSLIGTIGTAAELGADPLSGFATGAWRGVIGAAGLVVVSTLRGQAPWRYPLPVRWVAFGGLGVVFSQLLFFEAMARTGVAVGTLVAIGAAPLMAALIDWLETEYPGPDFVLTTNTFAERAHRAYQALGFKVAETRWHYDRPLAEQLWRVPREQRKAIESHLRFHNGRWEVRTHLMARPQGGGAS